MTYLSQFNLEGKKALVTGGAVGIGKACALALAEAGADVAIIDINEKVGEQTAATIRAMGRDAVFIRCDVSDKADIQAMVGSVVNQFGRLDIAINNAGTARMGPDESLDQEDWDAVMGLNLTGTWLCAQAEAQQMIRQQPTEGKIINIASMAARISIPGSNSAYDASKAAVVHMTRTQAAQWGRYNINVNSVSPSHILTPMFSHVATPETLARIREITPMGYVQRPYDMTGPVLFLASSASDYITGQDMVVDGGHTLSTWIAPLERAVPPRVTPEQEIQELKEDCEALGLDFGEQGPSHAKALLVRSVS